MSSAPVFCVKQPSFSCDRKLLLASVDAAVWSVRLEADNISSEEIFTLILHPVDVSTNYKELLDSTYCPFALV